MLKSLVAAVALLGGCALTDVSPLREPLVVDASSLTADQELLLVDAMERINDAAGLEVYRLDGDSPSVTVLVDGSGCDNGDQDGYSQGNALYGGASLCVSFSARLSVDQQTRLVQHELMHALGIPHDSEVGSIMGVPIGRDILPTHVAHIRAMAGE